MTPDEQMVDYFEKALRGIWQMLVMHVDPEAARTDALNLVERYQKINGFEVWPR